MRSVAAAVDVFSPEFQAHPFPTYAALRAESPVAWVPSLGAYLVSALGLVRTVVRDQETFSSAVPSRGRSRPPDDVAAEVAAIRARGLAYSPTLNTSDPPVHTAYRRVINRAFTPRGLTWMEPLVASTAEELARALPDGEVVDVVDAFSRPLPVFAIMRILGLSGSPHEVRRWSDAAAAGLGAALTAPEWLDVERTMLEFQTAICADLEDRRAAPRDDVLSTLVSAADGERPLANAELVWLVRELMVAGNETTARTLTEIVRQLDGSTSEWDRIVAEPSRASTVVEEGLRLSSPVQGMYRRATRACKLGGVTLAPDDLVFVVFGGANRDEAVFPDADAFDPDRAELRQHIAFGQGVHACVGAGLARLEATTAVRTLAAQVRSMTVVPGPLSWARSYLVHGLQALPVHVARRVAPPGHLER